MISNKEIVKLLTKTRNKKNKVINERIKLYNDLDCDNNEYCGGYAGNADNYNQNQQIFSRVFDAKTHSYTNKLDLTGGNIHTNGILYNISKYNKRPIYQVGNYISNDLHNKKLQAAEDLINAYKKRNQLYNSGIISQ